MENTYSPPSKDDIVSLFCLASNNDKRSELLAQSFYYYCAGSDPTPIIAFGAKFPLYVYVDSLICCNKFSVSTEKLYDRLHCKYKLIERNRTNSLVIRGAQNIEYTEWRDVDNKIFYIAYIQNDAAATYRKLYGVQSNNNYILPACICNYRNELVGSENYNILSTMEKRVEYILGYCYSDKYKIINSFKYFGDYSFDHECQVELWKRRYYFL